MEVGKQPKSSGRADRGGSETNNRKGNMEVSKTNLGWVVAFGVTILWGITLITAFDTVSVFQDVLANVTS